jgi:hypothetical protein
MELKILFSGMTKIYIRVEGLNQQTQLERSVTIGYMLGVVTKEHRTKMQTQHERSVTMGYMLGVTAKGHRTKA